MENIDIDKHAVLAEVLPDFLNEGPMLVEFKTETESDIRPAMILTTNQSYYPVDSKPIDNESPFEIWCWNVYKGGWYLLDLTRVETIQNWPPEIFPESE